MLVTGSLKKFVAFIEKKKKEREKRDEDRGGGALTGPC